MKICITLFVLFLNALCLNAQLTVLNVPSADITEKNGIYFRGDTTYAPISHVKSFTPNLMYGLGHDVEVSLNAESLASPGFGQIAITPGLKWRFLTPKDEGFFAYVGDKAYFPVHNKQYASDNYLYSAAGLLVGGLRVGVGLYNSQNVVASRNRTGGLITFEQILKTVSDEKGNRQYAVLAADWQSGRGSNGYLTLGVMFYPTRRLMLIPAYQLGNTLLKEGNHQAVVYVGYQLK
jgi:hypothetical protein